MPIRADGALPRSSDSDVGDTRRRHIAAKGRLTRARRHGSAEKIAAAEERERQAYAEFVRVSDVSIEEMLVINAAGLERLAELLAQMERAWYADP